MTQTAEFPVIGLPTFTFMSGVLSKQYRYKKSSDPDSAYTAWATYTTGTTVYIANYTGGAVPYIFQFKVVTSYSGTPIGEELFTDQVNVPPTTVFTLSNPAIAPAVQQSGTFDITVNVDEDPASGLSFYLACDWQAKDETGAVQQTGSFGMSRVGVSKTFTGSLTVGILIRGSTVYGDISALFSLSISHPMVLGTSLSHVFEDCWESTVLPGYVLGDSPEKWSWTYDTGAWSSVVVSSGEDLTSVKVPFTTLITDQWAASETSIELRGPNGASFIRSMPSSWSWAYEFNFGNLSSLFASSAGTWIVRFTDTWGTGGAQGIGGRLVFGS